MKKKKRTDKRKLISRVIAIGMAAIMLISTFSIMFSMRSYAAPASAKSDTEFGDFVLEDYYLAPGASASVDGEVLTNPEDTTAREPAVTESETAEKTTVPETTEPETTEPPETTTKSEKETLVTPPAEKKDKYTASFALYNVTEADKVTIVLEYFDNVAKKYVETELQFTKKNNYFISLELPVGTYTVKEIKTKERFVDITIDYEQFEIKENDMQNFSITATEDEANWFVQFLGRNWIFIIILIGLCIALLVIQKRKEM